METAFRRIATGRPARLLAGLALTTLQVAPVAAGLAYVLMPAFGHLPAVGKTGMSLDPWLAALSEPGLRHSIATTLVSGLPASLISLGLALALAARIAPAGEIARPGTRGARAGLQLVVAVPPVALAIGFAFLVAPSGWLARLLAPVLDWSLPPAWSAPRDPWGLSLGLALILKETPFLTLAALAALHQMRPRERLVSAIGLGYEPATAWIKVVLPELLARMRWPFFAVLAYALSAVDLASLLGPTNPAPLAVVIADLGRDADLARRLPASCLAVIQIAIVAGAWLFCRALARLSGRALRPWLVAGARELPQSLHRFGRWAITLALGVGTLMIATALASLPLWSIALVWRFPDPVPECCSFANWNRTYGEFLNPLLWSLALAVASSLAAIIAAILYLSLEDDLGARARQWTWSAMFLPLVTPDIAFLLGAQILFLSLGWRAGWMPVLWAHFLFAFPYVLLVLADSWRCLDPRYERIAACLGLGPWRRLVLVRLQLLRPALLFAGALGVAVSLSLYLPTLLLSGGRLATLATEAVALGAGGDRRVMGVHGSLQAVLAWLFFAWAALASHRHHRKAVRR